MYTNSDCKIMFFTKEKFLRNSICSKTIYLSLLEKILYILEEKYTNSLYFGIIYRGSQDQFCTGLPSSPAQLNHGILGQFVPARLSALMLQHLLTVHTSSLKQLDIPLVQSRQVYHGTVVRVFSKHARRLICERSTSMTNVFYLHNINNHQTSQMFSAHKYT